jgi:hypothetical protein
VFGGNCAATALAILALSQREPSGWDAEGALKWLCSARGIEGHWFWRWKFKTSDTQVSFDPDKFGWGWVPGTASWVIPTSFVLIALQAARQMGLSAPGAKDRIRLAADMLLDRACPHGGWNAGNSRVFGVPLSPHADATAIALLALRGVAHQSEQIDRALDRLVERNPAGAGPLSLAWTIIALHAYRDHRAVTGEIESRFPELERILQSPSRISDNTTLAVAALACDAIYTKNFFEVKQ